MGGPAAERKLPFGRAKGGGRRKRVEEEEEEKKPLHRWMVGTIVMMVMMLPSRA